MCAESIERGSRRRLGRRRKRSGRSSLGAQCILLISLISVACPAFAEDAAPDDLPTAPQSRADFDLTQDASDARPESGSDDLSGTADLELPELVTRLSDLQAHPSEADETFSISQDVSVTPKQRRYRYYKMRLLQYDRDLQVAGNDMVLKFKGPSKKRRLMSVELKF